MDKLINNALDRFQSLSADSEPDKVKLAALINDLQLVQDAYEAVIYNALVALMHDDLEESHDLLQRQRQQLNTAQERIGVLVESVAESEINLLKLILEYLFTRTRLVDELKMFPNFGLELLERLTLDESLAETIVHMELAMTGKRDLHHQLLVAYKSLG